jgi:hypothetical protein
MEKHLIKSVEDFNRLCYKYGNCSYLDILKYKPPMVYPMVIVANINDNMVEFMYIYKNDFVEG